MSFRDHFSSEAERYASFRPDYPDDLLRWLAALCPAHDLCWDAGTGSGQVAVVAARYFDRVYATDASASQIAHARPHPKVGYAVEPAENPDLPADSVDLITVGAAIHWLDRPQFYDQATRVGRPGGVVAAFSYGVKLHDSPYLTPVINRYVSEVLAPWWTDGHGLVLGRYAGLDFPFDTVEMPKFNATCHGNLASLQELLRTFSGAARMRQSTGFDPIDPIRDELSRAWQRSGSADEARALNWPIFGRVGRI